MSKSGSPFQNPVVNLSAILQNSAMSFLLDAGKPPPSASPSCVCYHFAVTLPRLLWHCDRLRVTD